MPEETQVNPQYKEDIGLQKQNKFLFLKQYELCKEKMR